MKIAPKGLALIGLFIALGIIFTRFASLRIPIGGIEGVRIGIGPLPVILAGIFFGPFYGFFVGAVADIVGYALSPIGPYMPHFTLTSALYGFIPGIMTAYFIPQRWNEKSPPLYFFWFIIALTQITVGLILTPILLNSIFGISWKFLVFPRLISIPLQILLFGSIIQILLKTTLFSSLIHTFHQSRLS